MFVVLSPLAHAEPHCSRRPRMGFPKSPHSPTHHPDPYRKWRQRLKRLQQSASHSSSHFGPHAVSMDMAPEKQQATGTMFWNLFWHQARYVVWHIIQQKGWDMFWNRSWHRFGICHILWHDVACIYLWHARASNLVVLWHMVRLRFWYVFWMNSDR